VKVPGQQSFFDLIEQAEAPLAVSQNLEHSDGPTSAVPLTAVLPDEDRERVSRALEDSRSSNTRKNYARAWTAFERWCLERGISPMPAEPEFIAAYLAERGESGWRIATIRLAWAAISDAHRQAGHPEVAEHLGSAVPFRVWPGETAGPRGRPRASRPRPWRPSGPPRSTGAPWVDAAAR